MSQAGTLEAGAITPDVPTNFVTDAGNAIPIGNTLEILGGAGINTSAAGNVVTISSTTTGLGTLQSDSGAPAVTPDVLGTIDITGSNGIITSGTGPGNVLTVSGITATDAQIGVVELATDAEVIDGTATDYHVVNPSSLKAKLGVQTLNGMAVGTGTTNAINWLGALNNGQIYIGSTGNPPIPGSLTSTTGTIIISPGAGTINLATGGTIATTYTTDAGSASPLAGTLKILGGNNIGSVGAGNIVTLNVDGTTNHCLQVGNATGSLTSLAAATNGQIPIGSTGADPVLGNITSTGQTLVVTNGAGTINVDTQIVLQTDTGFGTWSAGGPYFDDTTLGSFTVLVGGTGFIKGVPITWTGPQTVAGMTAGNTYYIYMDSTGTIGKVDTRTDALYEDNIVLFECLRDSTPVTNNQLTVKENHPYTMPVETSNYLHDVVGSVIENNNNGANIVINGTQGIQINGQDYLADHGLETTIPDSGGVAETWHKMYTTAAGKWATYNVTNTFLGVYNNAGTPTALGATKFAVYTLYVTKDNLNAVTPVYYAVLDTSQYNNLVLAQNAISNNTIARSSAELSMLETCQLGYIIFSQSADAIVQVIISKTTLKSTLSTAGTNIASLVITDTTNFDAWLSAADTNVQAALDTLDDQGKNVTPEHAVLVAGAAYDINSIAVGNTGELLVGATGADPAFGTIAYGNFTFSNLTPATPRYLGVNNADGAAGSTAFLHLGTPAGGDDHYVRFETSGGGGPNYSFGVDNSDGDLLKITTSSDPSSGTEALAIASATGAITFSNAYEFPIADGTASYPLTTDGSGNLDFTLLTVAGGGTGVATLLDHAVLVGSGTAAITPIAVGATGELLVGATGADPAFGTSADGNFTFTNSTAATPRFLAVENTDTDPGSQAIVAVQTPATGGDAFLSMSIGITSLYSWGIDNSDSDKIKLTNGANPSEGDAIIASTNAGVITLFNDLDVTEGGTGVSTLTSHGILLGNGAGDIQATAEPSNGQILIGKTGDFPQLGTLTAGAGISISNAAGSITITNTGAGAAWNFVDANVANMVVDNGYVCIAAGGNLTLGLPATAAQGTELEVALDGATSWTITQGAGQQIRLGNRETTAGAGGSLASMAQGDRVMLLCVTADTRWLAIGYNGNLTVT
jgi:hypothetical protein